MSGRVNHLWDFYGRPFPIRLLSGWVMASGLVGVIVTMASASPLAGDICGIIMWIIAFHLALAGKIS